MADNEPNHCLDLNVDETSLIRLLSYSFSLAENRLRMLAMRIDSLRSNIYTTLKIQRVFRVIELCFPSTNMQNIISFTFVVLYTILQWRLVSTVSSIVHCTSYEIFVDHKEIKIFFILKELNSIGRNL